MNIKTYNEDYFVGKPYESVFCSMYVVTSVTTSSLTETIPIAMLFLFCCQISTTRKHFCFPIIAEFKEICKEKFRNGIKFCVILTHQVKERTLIKVYVCF